MPAPISRRISKTPLRSSLIAMEWLRWPCGARIKMNPNRQTRTASFPNQGFKCGSCPGRGRARLRGNPSEEGSRCQQERQEPAPPAANAIPRSGEVRLVSAARLA